jgi:hypothetical protein
MFIDNRCMCLGHGAAAYTWRDIAEMYGEPADETLFRASQDRPPYSVMLAVWSALDEARVMGQTEQGEVLLELDSGGSGPLVIVVTGQHGDEPAGPLTMYEHASDLLTHAKARGVRLVLYPCCNPEGYELQQRSNARGDKYMNNWVEYEVEPGRWVADLAPDATVLQTRQPRMCVESTMLATALARLPIPVAALDLHQDSAPIAGEAYVHSFGDTALHRRLLEVSGAKPYHGPTTPPGGITREVEHGIMKGRDGTITDFQHMRGVRFAACLEVSTHTPIADAIEINYRWVKAMVDVVAQRGNNAAA